MPTLLGTEKCCNRNFEGIIRSRAMLKKNWITGSKQ